MAPPVSRPTPTPPAAAPAEKVVEKAERISAPAEPDRNLAEMANRLEPSLRRPAEPRVAAEISMAVKTEPMAPPPLRVTPESRIAPPEPRITPPEQKPARTEAKPKAVFESLEEEMASLLGRPPGKT
jgi:chromatin segregation and condensation protein Rec8/ScpA/Scc1 (kleisin family)